jgi:hypothetical protein
VSQYPYEQYPYDQQPQQQPAYPQQYPQQYGEPADQVPYQHPGYAQPGYQRPVYVAPPQPVQVNVTQYAGSSPVVVRKPVNHLLHFCLTLLTGGLWLFVWIPVAMRGGKTTVYR